MGMKKMSKKTKDNIFHTFNCKTKNAYLEESPCSITLIWDGWWWWRTFNGEVGEGWGGSFTWMGGPWKMGTSSIEEGFYWMLLHDGSQPSFLAPPYLYSTLLKCFLPLIFPYYIQTFFLQTQPQNQFLTLLSCTHFYPFSHIIFDILILQSIQAHNQISFYYHAHTNKNWVPHRSVI